MCGSLLLRFNLLFNRATVVEIEITMKIVQVDALNNHLYIVMYNVNSFIILKISFLNLIFNFLGFF